MGTYFWLFLPKMIQDLCPGTQTYSGEAVPKVNQWMLNEYMQLWPEIPVRSTYNPIYKMYNPTYDQL